MQYFCTLLKKSSARKSVSRLRRVKTFIPHIEPLESRRLLAVTASFIPSSGVLSVFGDSLDNTIVISRNAAGTILINGGAVSISGGTPTVANTSLIQAFGQDGNDNISLDEANGAMPASNLFGGNGNDTLIGGSAADLIFGQAGNDTLLGKGGDDQLFGGDGNDTLTGGTGGDQVFGQADNDRMIWNPGDGTDLNEGGDGIDTVEVNGGNGAETFTDTANGTRVRFDRITPAPFSLDIGTTENLVLNANGGDDSFTAGNGLVTLISIAVDGGAGNDTITGGDGNDILIGGDGNDVVIGGRGNDAVLMGAGADTFIWNPGDGSDTVEGQSGNDTMLFNGANINEHIDISANGSRVRFTRDVANITMDLNGVENVSFNALGGADTVTLNDMIGTDLTTVNLNLSASGGGGDGQADTVIVNGTNGDDFIEIDGSGTSFSVFGLSTLVNVTNSEGVNDSLVVNALGGDDGVDASFLNAGIVKLTVNSGDGSDFILGSQGNDILIGGDSNDFIDGLRGNDVALMGAGNDVFEWDPGDGSDTVEGQGGADRLLFFGSNANENIDISANGSRVLFSRDVGNITMDINGVEQVDFVAMGGADNITVNDLTGTDLTQVNLDLHGSGPDGGGDGQPDTVIVNGTSGNDAITATGDASRIDVTGLHASISIVNHESANDRLIINALGGADTVNASALQANVIQLSINGGDGDDLLIGSSGDDQIVGGRGNDTALMGVGNDVFIWNPGDGSDIVEGQGGTDRMIFNGANVSENINISANGGRVRFTRNVANITMDLNDVEVIDFNALGGADTVIVNDLSGTDVTEVNVNLGASSGGGDGQADNVIVNGTNGDDVIDVSGDANGVAVIGLSARVNITNGEAANDRLTINALSGNDVVTATNLAATAMALTENGGDGDDVSIGGSGNDTLLGGNGDDVLIGGPGTDILDGGPGNNTLIQ